MVADTIQYFISTSTAPAGPWTALPNSPFSTLTDVITGLQPGTNYYFQITAQDSILKISGSPVIIGPIATAPSSTLQESIQGTVVTGTTGSIVDAALNVWTLAAA